ncbi:hypothetical protein [Streptomyces sp. NPDC090025]|uniref:hypothetical protein n=1 Tax=Streptomyces sp. NPDC090025 TaxID=3365922 RepID=UPI00383892BE
MAFEEKNLIVLDPVTVGGRTLKRYHVTSDPAGIEPEVAQAAYALLPELLPESDGTPAAGFVVLHRGGDTGAYLNVYSWVWDNVLHFAGAAAGQSALDCPDTDPTHFVPLSGTERDRSWIGCVWELAPLVHERNAWVRHMLAPEVPDLSGYLADPLRAGTTAGIRADRTDAVAVTA